MTRPKVTWFRHGHEQRNDWLRFGFMRLARDGSLDYRERPYAFRGSGGFLPAATSDQKANSLLTVEFEGERQRCVVESNDSFFVMSELVLQADIYFCAGYNRCFFLERQLPERLSWQSSADVAHYRDRGEALLANLESSFDRVRPFIPISPNLGMETPQKGPFAQRAANLRHKIARRIRPDILHWSKSLEQFERRFDQLKRLRGRAVRQDITLLDTLWGWPRHRYALHIELQRLAESGYVIHSRLNWSPPSDMDGSTKDPLPEEWFPLTLGEVGAYEPMLASSRLAPLATGFHYGWRSIMALALMIGIPVLTDRILLEPWFGLDKFRIAWNDYGDWRGLRDELEYTTDRVRSEIASTNIAAFDTWMTPERTARYVLDTAIDAL